MDRRAEAGGTAYVRQRRPRLRNAPTQHSHRSLDRPLRGVARCAGLSQEAVSFALPMKRATLLTVFLLALSKALFAQQPLPPKERLLFEKLDATIRETDKSFDGVLGVYV